METPAPIAPFSAEDLRARALARLRLDLAPDALHALVTGGDHALSPQAFAADVIRPTKPAAVLVPIVARAEGATVLLTQRTTRLRQHSGQIAFPGGKIDPQDESPVAAALREAWRRSACTRAMWTRSAISISTRPVRAFASFRSSPSCARPLN